VHGSGGFTDPKTDLSKYAGNLTSEVFEVAGPFYFTYMIYGIVSENKNVFGNVSVNYFALKTAYPGVWF
jgi:hypothetical protein